MYIEHVAVWTHQLEALKDFYVRYFDAIAGEKHSDPRYEFESYSLVFPSGPRLELMQMPSIPSTLNDPQKQFTGFIHIAFEVATNEAVTDLTQRLGASGLPVMDPPHATSDGYFESAVLDPDGNRIEIMASRTQAR